MEYSKILDLTGKEGKLIESTVGNACSTLRLIVNKQCQLACGWCYQEGIDHAHSTPELSAETFIRVARIGKRRGFTNVNYSGGEPLLYTDLFRLEREIAAQGFHSYVTTNGVAIEQTGAAEQWKDIPNHEVHVSVNTLDDAEYRNITRRNFLASVLRGLSQLVDAKVPVKLNTVVSSEADWARIKRILDYSGERDLTVKLLGIHDTEQKPFSQKAVAEMLLRHGAEHVTTGEGTGVNYGYEQFIVDRTRVHVLDMIYGGGCCDKFRMEQCGEGIRYPRIIYTGEVNPCLHQTIGKISNESSDQQIEDILEKAKQFLRSLSVPPFHLDARAT
ncbi:MAG: radical SAM protein [Candidatus Peribacteraceae bacterium]|nr:radical SAM protein [Candidatus Peribacteraceae bacterium]MDD5742894.1 radical SAM protein [Candidatus Peribacteraceae bacterium]